MMWMKAKKFQRNIKRFGKVLKKEIETINSGEKIEYGKDLKKIGLNLMMICQLSKSSLKTKPIDNDY